MKSIFWSILLILITTSCAHVYFSEPQPQKGMVIKSFIEGVQGVYRDSTLDVEVLKNELVVSGEHYHLTAKLPGENEVMVKFYKDFYFASFKDSSYYSVLMGKFYENKLAIYMLNADEMSVNRLRKLVDVSLVDTVNKGYLMQPSKKQFDDLIDYDMFEVVNVLKKQ